MSKKPLVLLLSAALMLTACGKKNDKKESEKPSEPSISESTPAEPSEPSEPVTPSESTPAESEPDESEPVESESQPAESEESEPAESEPSESEESEPASEPERFTPTITIKYGDVVNTENGGAGTFKEGEIPEFTYEIDVDDAQVEAFYQNEAEAVINREDMVGGNVYSYHVHVTEDNKYNAVVRWVWFRVESANKVTPVVTIKYGEEVNTENGGAGAFKDNAIPDFTYEINVEGATVDAFYQDEATEARIEKSAMVAGGTYSYHVNVAEDDNYNAVVRWVWFTVVASSKVDPVVTIKYGDVVNTENGGAGAFPANAIPDFTYEINVEGATVDAYYQEEVNYTKIQKSDMVAGGTYSYHVDVTADDNFNAVARWVWFTVTEAEEAPVYTVMFGAGDPIQLAEVELDENDVAATVVKKYKASGLNVTAGDAILFALNGEEIEPGDEDNPANNTDGEYPLFTVHSSAESADLYLKLYKDGGYSFWLTGRAAPSLEKYALLNGEKVEVAANPGNVDEVIYEADLKVDDTIIFVAGELNIGYSGIKATNSVLLANCEQGLNDVIVIKTAGSYTFYVDVTVEESKESIWCNVTPALTGELSLTINLTLETLPTNGAALVYDVNRSLDDDWINNKGLPWNTMEVSDHTYTFTIEGLEAGDVVRFVFATWLEGSADLYMCGSDDWKPASYTIEANATLNCTASAFPASSSQTVVFNVA